MTRKNKYGQYFTEESIADFMVSLIGGDKTSAVLEPSCGKGVFLKILHKQGFENVKAYEIDKTLKLDYGMVEYKSFVSSPLSEHFDVIIGNPPYIRWKNLENELKTELEESPLWKKYFNSLCDYLFIFILKSIEQLNSGGELIFICPEYWMNTTHSATLRDYMVRNGGFSDIFCFKEAPLFEGVTSSFVIFRYVKAVQRNKILLHNFIGKGRPTSEELKSGECFFTEDIPAFTIGNRWLLASSEKQARMAAFQDGCVRDRDIFGGEQSLFRIGDYCDIGNGMVSGLDKAFRVADMSVLNSAEKQHLIKVNKAKDLVQYYSINTSYYIFVKDKMSEGEFKTVYPHFYEQLLPYRELLQQRYSYGRDIPLWEFAFPRNENLFRRNIARIFVPCKERISARHYFRFSFADMSYYPLQDVTGIFPNNKFRESIMYLLAYLNNERVYEWLMYNGIVKGNVVEFSEAPIASIPYRPIKWTNPTDIQLHNKIVDETTNYIKSHNTACVDKINNFFDILFNGSN